MTDRTSAGLRDIDEIDALRKPKGNPQRASAVAALARQIIGTVEAELKFATTQAQLQKTGPVSPLGSLLLGSSSDAQTVVSAETGATAA